MALQHITINKSATEKSNIKCNTDLNKPAYLFRDVEIDCYVIESGYFSRKNYGTRNKTIPMGLSIKLVYNILQCRGGYCINDNGVSG